MTITTNAVDSYISNFSDQTRDQLSKLRAIIRSEIPHAEERISYAIPAFWDKGYIVYFAGYKKHVSMYPVHNAKELFGTELTPYLSGKATARFPVDKPLPASLIKKIVGYLSEQNDDRKKK